MKKEHFFKMTQDFSDKANEYTKNEHKFLKLAQEWFKSYFGKKYDELYPPSNTITFTDEQIDDFPYLEELCTKKSGYRQLSNRNKKAKEILNSWRTFITDKGYGHIFKQDYIPDSLHRVFLMRNAFPNGYIKTVKDENDIYYIKSNCVYEDVSQSYIDSEIKESEYLQIELNQTLALESENK